MQYKVGDKVRIRKDLDTRNWMPSLISLVGAVVTIENIDGETIEIKEDIKKYHWYDYEFEPAIKTFADLAKGDVVIHPSGKELTVLARLEDLVFLSKFDGAEEAGFCYHYRELSQFYRIKQLEPETTILELTLDQVAEKFGVDVKDLKIKK